ncbi:MAG: hypothetical protein K2M48_02045, partial [Clostridiales bacterium]|nr:hypothetical protein [Clostridiales bacterium]
ATTVEIDRENETITFNEVVSYRYVGGSVDTLYFTQGGNDYSFKQIDDVTYLLKRTTGTAYERTLTYQELQEPIAIAKFSGRYLPTDGDKIDGRDEFVIYPSGNGYYVYQEYNSGTGQMETYRRTWELGEDGAEYVQKYNKLVFGLYSVTVNLDDNGDATGITIVKNGYPDSTTVYTRDGDSGVEIPKYLDIAIGDYIGDNGHSLIRYDYGSFLDEESANITDYDPDNNVYTVSAFAFLNGSYQEYTFKIKVVDDVTLELYDAGDELLDTLVRFVPTFANLQSGTDTIDTSTVKKAMYLYKAAKAGWYKVEWDGTDENLGSLAFFYGLDKNDPTSTWGETVVQASNGEVFYVESGDIVGVYFGYYYGFGIPETVEITLTETTVPAGRAESNPIVVNDGVASLGNVGGKNEYFFKFTAPKAGAYLISLSSLDDWGTESNLIHYVINGVDYGYKTDESGWNGSWCGGVTAQDPYASVTLASGEELVIVADRNGGFGVVTLTVKVFDDYSVAATDIDAAQITSGTLEDGVYKVTNFSGDKEVIGVTLTSDSDMTVTVMGKVVTGKSIALNVAQLKKGFKLECDGEVSYASACATTYSGECSIRNFFGGYDTTQVTLLVADDYSMVVYKLNGDEYTETLSFYEGAYGFRYDGNSVSFTVEGDSISFRDPIIGSGTLEKQVPGESDEITYADSDLTLVFEKELADMEDGETIGGTYIDSMGPADITITKSGDTYVYTGDDGIGGKITLNADGTISISDDMYYYGLGILTRQ